MRIISLSLKKPPVGKIRKLSDLFNSFSQKFNMEARELYRQKMLGEINNISHRILTTLSSYGARKLSGKDNQSSELLSFLSYLINLTNRDMVAPKSNLAAYLPYKRLFFDATTGTIALRDIHDLVL